MRKSDAAELFWSLAPWTLFVLIVVVLICCAPSVDLIVFGK